MVSFITINTNGLRDVNKRLSFLQWLSCLSIDFVCLQETHVSSCYECDSWFSHHGFLCVASPGSVHSCGSVILYRSKFELKQRSFDSAGRFVYAVFSLNDVSFALACVYAPNRNPDRDEFFSYVSDMVDPHFPTVLCGDFNAVFNRTLDRRGSNVSDTSRESHQALGALFDDCCVIDVWRQLHPNVFGSTWMTPDGSISSRIDIVGCPVSWLHCVQSCDIVTCPYSDHSAVLLKVSIPSPLPRGPGRWVLNTSLLSDVDFTKVVTDFWVSWQSCKHSYVSLQRWWDRGKDRLKGIIIRFSRERSKKDSSARSVLSNLLDHLKRQIDDGRDSVSRF